MSRHDEMPDYLLEDMADYRGKVALLNKLTVADLRILLVHYKLATDKRDAKDWPKADMVDALANEEL